MTTFYPTPDNVSTTTTGYTAASGSIALASGAGTSFGSSFPMLASTFLADGTPKGVYSVTGRSTDTLTGLTLVAGTDATLPSGAIVAVRWSAEHVAQYKSAINAAETTLAGLGTASTHAASDFDAAGSVAAVNTSLASHTSNTSNPHSVTKTQVGLGNADNTSDVNKPVSTATATALALKATLASPALTGVPTVPTATVGTNTTQAASTAFVLANAGGVSIGGAIGNGPTANGLLFADGSGNLANSGATWNGTCLTINNVPTGGINPLNLVDEFGTTLGFVTGDETGFGLVMTNGGGTGFHGRGSTPLTLLCDAHPVAATGYGGLAVTNTNLSAPFVPLRGASSTAAVRDVGYLDAGFVVSTDAIYLGYVALKAQDFNAPSGGRDCVRGWSDGAHGRASVSAPASAPTDSHLPASEVSFFLDESGNNLKVRVRYSDGTTLKTGTLALT